MQKEAKARIKINNLLEKAGWRFFDDDLGKANIVLENHIKITQKEIDAFGNDFEKTKNGYVDFLLLDDKRFPLIVLEAKSEDKDPLVGKEQARKYANAQNVRFIILSNGNIHYFWDKELGNPTRISHFPSLKSLHEKTSFIPDKGKLIKEEVKEDYVALTQNPYYYLDPRWTNESQRQKFIDDTHLKFLRPYQVTAVKKIQEAVSEGKNRFLFEMATGTGKTLTAAAIIKLYLRSNNARRILFLVDRLELEDQAKKNFIQYLKNDYETVVFKENRDDWRKAEIVVTTIQSISYENKYLKIFSPSDFDLVISDEAHRSISGNNRDIFEYFMGAKLGLTATPKDYLKNLDEKKLAETDPRELEKRILLSTYKTFGCENGVPTFRYTLIDGIKEGYLIGPQAIDCRTEITTKLLSEEGYAVLSEEDGQEEMVYKHKDFERIFFSERTNYEFVKTFMENALRDPISGEIGKTIAFCVSRKHATKITQILNEFAHHIFPGKYQSDFAIQVTSDVTDAQENAVHFAYNNLLGSTKFLEGYKSSKVRVCVTVGMMTTGYDCEDILNICLLRPIFSPTDFVQIKGRGTRKYIFKDPRNKGEDIKANKEVFKLFDFFANCEYFEEKFPYDAVLKMPALKKQNMNVLHDNISVQVSPMTISIPDPLKTYEVMSFENSIMRVDRELSAKFETDVKDLYKKIAAFKESIDAGDYEKMEGLAKEHLFDKPDEYYTLEKLRKSYHIDRRLSLWEILDKIFGKINDFKTKEELISESFERFTVSHEIPAELYYETRDLFRMYILDEQARTKINKKEFSYFADNPQMLDILQKLGKERIHEIVEYIKDNVSFNKYL